MSMMGEQKIANPFERRRCLARMEGLQVACPVCTFVGEPGAACTMCGSSLVAAPDSVPAVHDADLMLVRSPMRGARS